MSTSSTLRATGAHAQGRRISGLIFMIVCLGAIVIGILTLAVLLVDVLYRGLPGLSWSFLTSFPSRFPEPGRDPVSPRWIHLHALADGALRDPDRASRPPSGSRRSVARIASARLSR